MRKLKDANYDIKFEDRDYLVDLLEDYNISPEELCFQMTAYETDGAINYDRGIRDIISDYSGDEPTAEDFYEYLEDNDYEMVFPIGEFDEFEKESEPLDIASRTFYGEFNPTLSEYYSYDGQGNYKGYYDIKEAMDEYGDDFKVWFYMRKYDDLISDEDFKSQIINGTLQLVKQGY